MHDLHHSLGSGRKETSNKDVNGPLMLSLWSLLGVPVRILSFCMSGK